MANANGITSNAGSDDQVGGREEDPHRRDWHELSSRRRTSDAPILLLYRLAQTTKPTSSANPGLPPAPHFGRQTRRDARLKNTHGNIMHVYITITSARMTATRPGQGPSTSMSVPARISRPMNA